MNHPHIANLNGHERYSRMLAEAANSRRIRTLPANQSKTLSLAKLRSYFNTQRHQEGVKTANSPSL
jgi:hypothetical protein